MVAGTRGKFACASCGKVLVWKPELAGRRVKCSCGGIMTVPAFPAGASPQGTSINPPPPMAQVAPAQTLGYVSARKGLSEEPRVDKLIDPIRDTYVPVALLAIGFIAMVLWAMVGRGVDAKTSMIVLLASGLSTSIKTAVLIAVGFGLAYRYGVSFGTFWSAVLKFSSIIIFTDSMLMWLEVYMRHTGAITAQGRGHWSIYIVELMTSTAAIAMIMKYYFDMDREELVWVAGPIAFASMFVGCVLNIGLAVTLKAILARAAPPPPAAVAPAPAAQPVQTTSSKPMVAYESAHDREIRLLIEGGQSKRPLSDVRRGKVMLGGGRFLGRLFEQLTQAGAKGMYVDNDTYVMNAQSMIGPKLYVELPENAAGRATCFTAYTDFCKDNRLDPDAVEEKDTGQKYMVIQLLSSGRH